MDKIKDWGKEHMLRVPIFNNNNALSLTTAKRIVRAGVIVFILLNAGTKDMYIFAQTAEKGPGIAQDEQTVNSI
ncbi:MAG: hypothetical protein L6416_00285 [Candidatus Omnitrophica bacterium]|nr:hypothetical protein [Candidatus Omnitrophota bacterium]